MHYLKLSKGALAKMTEGAQLIEADGHGPKVYRLQDGNFLKLFRRKRLISSAFWSPYSKRFCDNAKRLRDLGIATLLPLELFKLDGNTLTAVRYKPLQGVTLAQIAQRPDHDWATITPALIELIRRLHQKGIYFRSLHLGNIVQMPDGRLGLIDIADMRLFPVPLSAWLGRRNLAHFERYLRKEGLYESFPFDQLVTGLLHSNNAR